MLKVEFNNKSVNPFYGMSNTLEIFQDGSKGSSFPSSKLDKAWAEAKTPEQKAILLTVLFSIGDVTGRQHNLFEGKVDAGGNSQREVFRDTVIPFLVAVTKKLPKAQRMTLIKLIVEYTTMDNIVAARVQTKKNSRNVQKVINMIKVFGVGEVAEYISGVINKGTVFEKMCVAKFVTRPRFSKRSGKTQMLAETKAIMHDKAELIELISDNCKFVVENKGNYKNFLGFYEWRKEFNQNLESVLFSSGRIKDMDKNQFMVFLEQLPSDARFRVRNRVMFGDKWTNFGDWYKDFEKFKEEKQAEQRQIETKIEQGLGDEKDAVKLKQVKKEAKVNTGAISFTQLFSQIVTGSVDELKIQPFLDKINLPYNSLVFADDSGSMNGGWGSNSSFGFSPRQFAAFIATIVLSKNPDPDARDMIGLFSSECRMFNGISSYNTSPNSLLNKNVVKTAKKGLINSEDKFLDNLRRMKGFLDAESTSRGTNIGSVPDNLHKWAGGDSNKIEELQRYPVWTFISDGNFNNSYSAESSMSDFMRKCENYFGFRPFVILIDVAGTTSAKITRFSGVDNVMMIPPNPANIEMFLTNFKDMDTYDVYTPLLSLSRSSRYAPVRKFVEDSY